MAKFTVNGREYTVEVDPQMPMLWVLRDVLDITGPKFGCGKGQCWGCTVLLDGKARPSCTLKAKDAEGAAVTTIEGIAEDHPVKRAWVAEQVPQCGYCQPGQILQAVALLAENPEPDDAAVAKAMQKNLCRCGTYTRIAAAVRRAAKEMAGKGATPEVSLPGDGEAPAPVFSPNPFVRVAADGTVTVLVKHLEAGQGAYTGLATLVAEEMDAAWEQMRAEGAPADERLYNNLFFGPMQGTGGSTAIANSFEQYRTAGAEARALLVAAAAEEWDVPAAEIDVAKGVVRHGPSGREAGFGGLAAKAEALREEKGARNGRDIPLKNPADFGLIGRQDERLDIPAKVAGRARFAMDVRLPGMLTAVVARPPRFGGRVKSFDPAEALDTPGVREVVEIPQGVAVVAENTWAALRGREALSIEWDDAGAESRGSEELFAEYREAVSGEGLLARRDGDAAKALAQAAKTVEAVFEFPYLAHAPLEPLNCVARMTDEGRLEIFAGDQFQTVDQQNAANAAGLDRRQVDIRTVFAGGSFGRRANPPSDYVSEAAQVLRALKEPAPVHLVWSREDDIRGGRYRPLYVHSIRAGLDAEGRLTAWEQHIAGQSLTLYTPFEAMAVKDGIDMTTVEGAADLPYAVPGLTVAQHTMETGVTTLWWRSVGHSHSAFAVEVVMDELARAAGRDPLEFRRDLLAGHPRHLGVLELAADKAGWGSPLPEGHARGLAVHESFGSFVAHVAEIAPAEDGGFSVERVVCAVDCGRVVNPAVVRAQMEGGITFGLSAAWEEGVTLEEGRVKESNFHDYKVLRFARRPKRIEVHVVESSEPPTGVGEPGVPPIAPAVANALFAATGRRIRRLPWGAGAKQG
ncbi:aldehyde oxidase and xanthine dehydrogenase molybdopterin binding protein [Desulfovibrio sp. X2]|uniref:molybdopterin-dependent oxidoreductase n=1 Tax=Desulfovibrio sp. X2 TaxID=941449 RepID=UPI0003586E6F|nr:molybdopterin-dependent oxidoreductase [Desulfovibrio sp. X2]EPR39848.1 aldehyde oxidase and xanthine dehydrogenase molybdopterin binding protein [Desulfovibrio sp. X2]